MYETVYTYIKMWVLPYTLDPDPVSHVGYGNRCSEQNFTRSVGVDEFTISFNNTSL